MYIHWQPTPQQLFTTTVNNQLAKSDQGQSNCRNGNKEYKGQVEGGLSDRTWAEESRMLIKHITFI